MVRKFLVVDDEESLRQTIAQALHRRGHTVHEASNTADGLQLALEVQPDLIISDVSMDGGDGISLLRSIRSNERTANIPFLIMTGQPNWDGMVSGVELAADAYIPKPFSIHTLLSAIEHRLNREDIHKKRAEEIKVQLHRILEAAPDLIGIIDPVHHTFNFLNTAGRKLLGLSSTSELAGLHLKKFLPPDTIDRLQKEAIPSALVNGTWGGESVLLTAAGRRIPVKQFFQAHRNEDGEISYLSTIAHDLTEDKQAEEALRESERKFRSLVDAFPDAVVIQTTEGKIAFGNLPTERLFHYGKTELLGKRFDELFEFDPALPPPWAAMDMKLNKQIKVHCRRKNGDPFPAHLLITEFEASGERIRLSVIQDLSEQTRLEQERQNIELQLSQALKLESIGQLAAGIAHEINTPTQYIGDNVQFLRDGFAAIQSLIPKYDRLISLAREIPATAHLAAEIETDIKNSDLGFLMEEIPKAIEQSLEGIQRVSRIVGAMKDFSHPGTTEKTKLDLNHAIESTITVARNEWKYVAEVETRFDPHLPPVSCIPGEINQVILNLIVNAAHSIGEREDSASQKGTITVTTAGIGKFVEIQVKDTGRGIPLQLQDKIFEPFFTTKGVGKGTGQGLAIARSVVVEKHGGRIEFQSVVGTGTTFIIQLPI